MLELNIWHATKDVLVRDDVIAWRDQIDTTPQKMQSFAFHGYVPENGTTESNKLFAPMGLFGGADRTVIVWNASEVPNDDLLDVLYAMNEDSQISFYVALIRTGKDFSKDVYAYEPEELDYALVDPKNPVRWMDGFLTEYYNLRLSDSAYQFMESVTLHDYELVATTLGNLMKFVAPADEETDLGISDLTQCLEGVGGAEFFALSNAVNDGDIATAADLAARMEPSQIHGLIAVVRNRALVTSMKSDNMKMKRIQDAMRRPNKSDKPLMTPKQVEYLYRNSPKLTPHVEALLWKTIAQYDEAAKSGGLTGTSVLEFATTVALINKNATTKSRR